MTASWSPPSDVDLVAGTTTDPAKTLTRWWPDLKERYYATRRRKTPPGPLQSIQKRSKYRITEWAPNRLTRLLSEQAIRRALDRRGFSKAKLQLFDHHHCHAAAAVSMDQLTTCRSARTEYLRTTSVHCALADCTEPARRRLYWMALPSSADSVLANDRDSVMARMLAALLVATVLMLISYM